MFIVNSDGNICEEVCSIHMVIRQDETIIEKINKKGEDLSKEYYGDIYPYGVFKNILEYKIMEYAKQFDNEIEIAAIYVNDTEFGVYKRKIGEKIFKDIISALKKKEILFDLRDYEKMNED